MDKKDYLIIGLSIATLISLGFNAMPNPTHYCESRLLQAHCFDLSSTQKTCYTIVGKQGGKRCTEGWKEIPTIPTVNYIPQYTSSGQQWICSNINCTIK